ncbi:hypothetical protein Tco_1170602, partial [Tanacetum coccineum]
MRCCLTSWFSKKQTTLVISTTEAEYVSTRKACQQALLMKPALVDYDKNLDDIPVLCDNKGAIDLSKNHVPHSRTKHIEIRHHFLRNNVQKGNILIQKVSSEDNIADILTNPIKREPFNLLRLGLPGFQLASFRIWIFSPLEKYWPYNELVLQWSFGDSMLMDGDDLEEFDLRWQVAMLTIRVKKSRRNQGRRSYGDNGRSNAPTIESSSQALVAQDGLGSYDWSNDFELEPVNYALMAISFSSSSSSSDSEVQKCSKQCHESFKTLQKNYDTEREKHNKAKLEIRAYKIALESLESRILRNEKNELAWEKVVKEIDELKDKIAKWEESTKNLEEILKSQMSARVKTSLGYSTQLNELSSNFETDSKNSFSVFDGRCSDEESTLANDRFSKADGYKVVPPPITGNFLTPRADISFAWLDEYAFSNKIIESQTIELNTKTSETAGKTNDANTEKPKSVSESVVSNPKINKDSVIIKDYTSDDEEEVYGVQKVRLENQAVKT